MANDKKFIVKNGLRADNVEFTDSQSGSNQITLNMLNTDTLNFEGDAGTLFGISDDLTGIVFSVNDVSGIPILEVDGDTHNVSLAEYDGKVMIGGTDSGSTDSDVLNVTGNIKATNFIGPLTGDVTGAASQVTVADESTDTTCFPLFTTAASGNLAPKSGSNLTFNSSTGVLSATKFSGDGSQLSQLDASEISSGTISNDRISLTTGDIPNLAAGKITSGTFDSARVPIKAIGTGNVTSGVFDSARIPTAYTSTHEFNAGGATYDPSSTGSGTDTSTTAAISLADGMQIVGHNAGFIRNLLEFNNGGALVIGQGNTSIIQEVQIKGGSGHGVELYDEGTKRFETTSSGAAVNGTITATTFSGSGASLTSIPAGQLTGTIADARIPNLAASKITSGVFDSARIPVTGDITAAKITSGIIDSARLPAGTFGGGGGGTADAIAADNIQVGDAAINLTTNTGNITIDAQGNNTDIIFKGTDGGVDRTFLTIDGSEAGKATFLSEIVTTGLQASGDTFIDSDGGFFFDVSDQALKFGDNYRAKFGASGDLQMYHDGSHSRISEVGTGDFILNSTSGDLIFRTNTSENSIIANNNGAVELYHDNSKKFETTDSGAAVFGNLLVGANSPATAPHSFSSWTASNASDAHIDALIDGSTFGALYETRNSAHLVIGIQNNDVNDGVSIISNDSNFNTHSVYNNHVVSFKADGDIEIDSSGALMYDKSDKALEFGDNYKAVFGAGADLQIFHDGTNSRIYGTTGDTHIGQNAFGAVKLTADNDAENMLVANVNGSVELYHDNSKKLETASGGVSITGTATATTFSGSGASLTSLPAGQLTGTIDSARLPDLATSDITSGTLDSARLPVIANANLAAKATALANARNIDVTGVTATAASFDGTGNIDIEVTAVPATLLTGTINNARISLDASEIPNLAASKITSGTLDSARVPVMSIGAGNITSGTIASARLSLSASDIPNLATSKITSGTLDSARLPVIASANTANLAATATALATARNIGGVSFDGTENINLPGVNQEGSQNTSGTAAIATSINAVANNSNNETVYLTFVDGATGTQGIETDTGLTYNPSTGLVTATKFSGDGSALTGISAGVSEGIFLEYQKRVVGNYNIDAGVTALTACNDSDGIEIISGVTVTISDSSGWVITGGDKNMGLDAMVATSNQTERTMRTGTIKPTLNNTYDLGDSAVAWRNIYTNDLNLSNETGSGNDVDGTTGKWTIQEGEENLYIINRKTGKKYKFMLEEIV